MLGLRSQPRLPSSNGQQSAANCPATFLPTGVCVLPDWRTSRLNQSEASADPEQEDQKEENLQWVTV